MISADAQWTRAISGLMSAISRFTNRFKFLSAEPAERVVTTESTAVAAAIDFVRRAAEQPLHALRHAHHATTHPPQPHTTTLHSLHHASQCSATSAFHYAHCISMPPRSVIRFPHLRIRFSLPRSGSTPHAIRHGLPSFHTAGAAALVTTVNTAPSIPEYRYHALLIEIDVNCHNVDGDYRMLRYVYRL